MNFTNSVLLKKALLLPGILFISLLTAKAQVSNDTSPYTPKSSVINLPVEMKVSNLEAVLNKQLTGLIYEDNNIEDDNMMVKAWKKENIRINFENGAFLYRVPLKLWIRAGWKVNTLGVNLSDYREANAEIALVFKTSVTLNKNWTMTTKTVSQGYQWLSAPVVEVGPVKVPITFIADVIVKSNLQTISKAMDDAVQKNVNLVNYAKKAWVEVQEPMLINDTYKLWMRITPKSISAIPISGGKGIVRQVSGIEAVTECFTGKKPLYKLNPVLPDLKITDKMDETFVVNVTSYVNFAYIDSITKSVMTNTKYEFGKKGVTITAIKAYGDSTAMVFEADVTGSVKAKMFFSGQPVYRASDSAIVMKDLHFHVKTKNILLKTASWLANSGIEKMMQKRMIYPIGQNIRETLALIRQSMSNYSLGQGFYLRGTLDKFEVQPTWLTRDAIVAPVSISGKLNIAYQDTATK